MELQPRDPTPLENNPESPWDLFREPSKETDEEKERKKEARRKTKTEEKPSKPSKPKKESTTESESAHKSSERETKSKDISPAPESNIEAKKQILAKEYIAARQEELTEQLDTALAESTDHAAITADIALLTELDHKLDDPNLEVSEAVESAYIQIMEELDEAINPREETAEAPKPQHPLNTETINSLPPNKEGLDIGHYPPIIPALARYTRHRPRRGERHSAHDSNNSTSPSNTSYDKSYNTVVKPDIKPTTPTAAPRTIGREQASPRPTASKPEAVAATSKKLITSGAIGAFLLGKKSAQKAPPKKADRPLLEIRSAPEASINKIPKYYDEVSQTIGIKEQLVQKHVHKIHTEPTTKESYTRPNNKVQEVSPKVLGPDTPNLQPSPYRMERVTAMSTPEKYDNTRRPEVAHTESRRSPGSHKKSEKQTASQTPIEQLSAPELLQIAHHIKIDGVSARNLFERNEIDHRGLVAIVKESLRGGDIARTLSKHRLGEEAKRGRNIEMRHDDPASIPLTSAGHQPDNQVQEIIEKLQKTQATIKSEKIETIQPNMIATTDVDIETDVVTLSKQKAQAAIKRKQLVTTSITAAVAIGLGAAISLLILR